MIGQAENFGLAPALGDLNRLPAGIDQPNDWQPASSQFWTLACTWLSRSSGETTSTARSGGPGKKPLGSGDGSRSAGDEGHVRRPRRYPGRGRCGSPVSAPKTRPSPARDTKAPQGDRDVDDDRSVLGSGRRHPNQLPADQLAPPKSGVRSR